MSHRTATRLRIRVPARRHDDAWWRRLGEEVRGRPGVAAVEVNATTAGMLIVHDGSLDPERLELGDDIAPLRLTPAVPASIVARGTLVDQAHRQLARLDAQLRVATAGRLDLASAALVGLTATMVVQLLRGRPGGAPAVTLAWYAAELIRTRVRNDAG